MTNIEEITRLERLKQKDWCPLNLNDHVDQLQEIFDALLWWLEINPTSNLEIEIQNIIKAFDMNDYTKPTFNSSFGCALCSFDKASENYQKDYNEHLRLVRRKSFINIIKNPLTISYMSPLPQTKIQQK